MSFKHSRRLHICVLLLALWSPVAGVADAGHPLEPLDLSSPRATLNSFLTTGDAFFNLLRDMLLAHPRIIDDEPRVRFAGFGDFSLNVEIRVNIDTSNRDEFRAIREDIYLRVMKIVKVAGTGFAFPSRTVYHARDGGLDTEHQQEAEAQVRAWCSAPELPFPTFTADYRKKTRNTLDYPPEGSPEGSE